MSPVRDRIRAAVGRDAGAPGQRSGGIRSRRSHNRRPSAAHAVGKRRPRARLWKRYSPESRPSTAAGRRCTASSNPQSDALVIADRLDAERKSRGPRGPLHGVPILLKDNIATADRMMTTAGSLALAGIHARPKKRVHRRSAACGWRRDSRQATPKRMGYLVVGLRAADGADAVGRRRTPTRSIAILPAPVPARAPQSRPI